MTVTAPATIEVVSTVPGDPYCRRTAELLSYPTLDEIRRNEGSQEELKFKWQLLGNEDPVTTAIRVASVDSDPGGWLVRATIGQPERMVFMKVEITYDDERPGSFRYVYMK